MSIPTYSMLPIYIPTYMLPILHAYLPICTYIPICTYLPTPIPTYAFPNLYTYTYHPLHIKITCFKYIQLNEE